MSLNTTTWMVSDTHWHHDKIRGYCNRPYESMEEMNEGLNNIISNETISECLLHYPDVIIFETGLFVEASSYTDALSYSFLE